MVAESNAGLLLHAAHSSSTRSLVTFVWASWSLQPWLRWWVSPVGVTPSGELWAMWQGSAVSWGHSGSRHLCTVHDSVPPRFVPTMMRWRAIVPHSGNPWWIAESEARRAKSDGHGSAQLQLTCLPSSRRRCFPPTKLWIAPRFLISAAANASTPTIRFQRVRNARRAGELALLSEAAATWSPFRLESGENWIRGTAKSRFEETRGRSRFPSPVARNC